MSTLNEITQIVVSEKQNAIYALVSGNSIALVFFDLPFLGKLAVGLVLSVISGACIKGVEFTLNEYKLYRTGQPNVFVKKAKE